ncbi:hypothetical protein [Patulibacter minatonensis]|uniref:hypothetical protein n=1 Tax=Patulibacter minatonensis TaxID=298163 RepID=UPI0004787B19|nr:hypothetical protein [Patulibacter minatonensis]
MPRAPRRPSRRRIAAAVALAVFLTAIGVVLLLSAEEEPPLRPSGASLRLVPEGALIAVEVAADQTTPQVDDALRRLDDLPGGTALLGRLRDGLIPGGCPAVPVSAREVTVALVRVRDGGPAAPLVLVERGGRRTDAGPVRRCGGRTVQRLGRFLAIGPATVVRQARALLGVPGARGSLAALPLQRRLVDGLPRNRLATAWLSPDGVRRVLATRGRGAATIAAALDRPVLGGIAIGATPTGDGARLVVRTDTAPNGSRPFSATTPVLAPSGAVGTILTTDPLATTSRVLDAIAASRGEGPEDVAALLSSVVERIDVRTGGRVRRDVVGAQRSPSEVVLTPGPDAEGRATGPDSRGLAVTVVVPVTDGRRAASALAGLRPRLARALGDRRVDVRRVAGRRSWALRLPGGGGAGYLVDGDRVVVYTSRAGAEAVLAGGPRLTDRVDWDRDDGRTPNVAMSIGFLDFSLLLRVAAPPAGSLSSADRALLDGLRRVRSASLRSRTDGREDTLDVDLRIP